MMLRRLTAVIGIVGALCASPALADSQKLADGFEGADFAAEGGLYYKDNAEQKAGVVEFQKDVVHSGSGALKLTVKPLCNGEEGCSERGEIWERTKLRAPYEDAVWYGFAVKFAEPVPTDDHRYLIAQWKREIDPGAEGDFSPYLAFRLRNGKLFISVETNYRPGLADAKFAGPGNCAPNGTPVFLRPDTNQMRALVAASPGWSPADGDEYAACTDQIKVVTHSDLPSPSSGWIDFAVLSKPGPTGDGRIEVFANGKPVVTVTGMIGHNDKGLGKNQYFKFGPYRDGRSDDWTLYYDDFRRSPNCADVLKDSACPAS